MCGLTNLCAEVRKTLQSVHHYGCVVMIAGQAKGQLAILDKCKLLSVRIVNRIKLFQTFDLLAHLEGQIRNSDSLDVHCAVLSMRIFVLHLIPLF